jgi:hypothetical protein
LALDLHRPLLAGTPGDDQGIVVAGQVGPPFAFIDAVKEVGKLALSILSRALAVSATTKGTNLAVNVSRIGRLVLCCLKPL